VIVSAYAQVGGQPNTSAMPICRRTAAHDSDTHDDLVFRRAL
jgi:hypothetical protein